MNRLTFCKIFLAASLCLSASVVNAAGIETLSIKKQTSHYMNMGQLVTRIAVGNPDIASVVQLPGSASEFLVVTKTTAGSTSLFVWTRDGARHEYLIVVSPEDPGQAMLIERAINLPDVHVKMVGERILLTGTVENQYEKNYALQTARLFVNASTESSLLVGSGFDMTLETQSADSSSSSDIEVSKSESSGAIIDLLQIRNPTQIRLEAQIIEINSDDAKDLGIQYGTDGSGGIFYFGENYTRDDDPVHFRNNPFKWIGQHFSPINATITALVEKGKAKLLSRPSVMTLSGEQATIQIGGEIPYKSTNNNGGSNTDFKDYGIILQFKPVVDAQKRINSAIHTEVSSPTGETVNGEPIIGTRRADSVITLHSGSPIVIGGLMDSSETKIVQKIPLLGDIPIIGEFFKHTSKSRDKRELIIVVTPYLVGEDERSQSPISAAMMEWMYQEQQYIDAMNNFDFAKPNFDAVKKKDKTDKISDDRAYAKPTDFKEADGPFK
ncbi:MAG: pilus assembly protein N-terminal domain-containing protein [Quinella sp. 2Q5]|nr:pilus assembly protein N-terminal domain-containing protein [Quinella sp. 2Q5]